MLVSENFPHFHHTSSTIQTQCWFLKLLSHLWPTTTLLWPFNPYPYPYTSRFGLHWNPRKQFCLPLQKYMWCRPTSLFILFHRRCLPASEPSQFISLFTIARALHWETTSAKIKLRPQSYFILYSYLTFSKCWRLSEPMQKNTPSVGIKPCTLHLKSHFLNLLISFFHFIIVTLKIRSHLRINALHCIGMKFFLSQNIVSLHWLFTHIFGPVYNRSTLLLFFLSQKQSWPSLWPDFQNNPG